MISERSTEGTSYLKTGSVTLSLSGGRFWLTLCSLQILFWIRIMSHVCAVKHACGLPITIAVRPWRSARDCRRGLSHSLLIYSFSQDGFCPATKKRETIFSFSSIRSIHSNGYATSLQQKRISESEKEFRRSFAPYKHLSDGPNNLLQKNVFYLPVIH